MSAPASFRFAPPNLLSASPRPDSTAVTDLSARRQPPTPRDGTPPQPPIVCGLFERPPKPASAGDLSDAASAIAPIVRSTPAAQPAPIAESRRTASQPSATVTFDELLRQRSSLEANASALVVQQEARIKSLVRAITSSLWSAGLPQRTSG